MAFHSMNSMNTKAHDAHERGTSTHTPTTDTVLREVIVFSKTGSWGPRTYYYRYELISTVAICGATAAAPWVEAAMANVTGGTWIPD